MSREILASKPCIDLKSYRKIYSSVDNLYAWVYNEMKEKNCLFDEMKDFGVMKVASHSDGSRIRYFCISGGQETGVEGWRMAAFVVELAFIFAIEGQKCESEKTRWKEKDGRDRQVV